MYSLRAFYLGEIDVAIGGIWRDENFTRQGKWHSLCGDDTLRVTTRALQHTIGGPIQCTKNHQLNAQLQVSESTVSCKQLTTVV